MGSSLKEATILLHRHHLKATKPRIKILHYLMTHHDHPTAAMFYDALSNGHPTQRVAVLQYFK